MAEQIKIIDPFDSYEMTPQEDSKGVYGNDLLASVQSLQVGFGTQVLRIDRDGLWLGAETFSAAPFSVSMAGAMVATSLDLSGNQQVGDSLADIQALIGDIGDISSDLGTISAGSLVGVTVTGGTVRTSSSGARILMDGANDALYVYDASAKRMQLDNDEITFYNSSGNERGGITTGTTELYFHALNGGNLHLEAEGSLYTIIFTVAGTQQGYWSTSGLTMNNHINMNSNDIIGIDEIVFDKRTSTPNRDGEVLHYDNGSSQSMRVQMDGTDYTFDLSFL